MPGGKWQRRAKPQDRYQRVLSRKALPSQKRSSAKIEKVGSRVQPGSTASGAQGKDSRRARARTHPSLQTCKESFLTNTTNHPGGGGIHSLHNSKIHSPRSLLRVPTIAGQWVLCHNFFLTIEDELTRDGTKTKSFSRKVAP